ncbi:hypothetical protein BURC_01357 [Burkholderiaceae bacterium]|nr:hypothetical protein BURC_01357 [Burkholderiaceae bacterium]
MSADPLRVPLSGDTPAERLARALPLAGTRGQDYVERRGIALDVADAAGLRFDPDWAGRAAVLVGLHDGQGQLTSVHGRYLTTLRGQDKMLTVGPGGGVVSVLGGWRHDPLILVEGLFDALSLAVCETGAAATIGRWAPWLPQVCAGRAVWLGFDANRPGEHEAARYAQALPGATVRRLAPPPGCKDWSTALVKRGRAGVTRWLRDCLAAGDTNAR